LLLGLILELYTVAASETSEVAIDVWGRLEIGDAVDNVVRLQPLDSIDFYTKGGGLLLLEDESLATT
jgi:hypothetical protein